MLFNKTASAIPPPRFVTRSSMSLLRSVSVVSANAARVAVAAGVALAIGAAETDGAAEGLVSGEAAGVADVATAGAGRRGVCLASHHSHATKPMTQSEMTVHAVRSIKFVS